MCSNIAKDRRRRTRRVSYFHNYQAANRVFESVLRLISRTALGNIAEELVRADLRLRGFTILPKKDRAFDILAAKDGVEYRIEVRTVQLTRRTGSLRVPHKPKDAGRSETYAAVCFTEHCIVFMGPPGDSMPTRITDVGEDPWWECSKTSIANAHCGSLRRSSRSPVLLRR